MAKTTIHCSNSNVNAAQMSRFLFWAKNHPEEAFQQAQEERETRPWMLRALRSDEGKAVAEAIKVFYLDALREAEAKLASTQEVSPAHRAAQLAVRAARQRYSEVEKTLRPRPRRRR